MRVPKGPLIVDIEVLQHSPYQEPKSIDDSGDNGCSHIYIYRFRILGFRVWGLGFRVPLEGVLRTGTLLRLQKLRNANRDHHLKNFFYKSRNLQPHTRLGLRV